MTTALMDHKMSNKKDQKKTLKNGTDPCNFPLFRYAWHPASTNGAILAPNKILWMGSSTHHASASTIASIQSHLSKLVFRDAICTVIPRVWELSLRYSVFRFLRGSLSVTCTRTHVFHGKRRMAACCNAYKRRLSNVSLVSSSSPLTCKIRIDGNGGTSSRSESLGASAGFAVGLYTRLLISGTTSFTGPLRKKKGWIFSWENRMSSGSINVSFQTP
mmetsp:Transcript_84487/g.225761  ORF Transcript_84487/g.225761 Transcript_84487/m.225761 type:complete len:217 (-) Transcript_84487:346-996(-)